MIEFICSFFYYSLFYLISSSEAMVFNFSKIFPGLYKYLYACLTHSFKVFLFGPFSARSLTSSSLSVHIFFLGDALGDSLSPSGQDAL